MIKKPEALICHGSGVRIQNLKSLSENSCSGKGSGISFTISLYLASLTWFFQSIKLLYLFTAASGMATKGVNILSFHRPVQSGGLKRLPGTDIWIMNTPDN